MVDREIALLAREVAKLKRSVAGLAQTRQVSRTIVNDVELGETLIEAQEVAFIVDEHADDLDLLDNSSGIYEADMAQDAADAAFKATVMATENVLAVQEAHEASDKAAQDALKAQYTADGRNRIFAQALNPVALPEIPFVNGDLWYRTELIDGVTKFAEVFMWNGTEWKPYQLVASSILVPGTVGNLLLEDGGISGTKLAFDAIYGKTILGALISGSVLKLSGLTNPTFVVDDNGSSLTNWYVNNMAFSTITLDTAVKETGTSSIRIDRGTATNPANGIAARRAWGAIASDVKSVKVKARIRVPTATNVYVGLSLMAGGSPLIEQSAPIPVEANTWTTIEYASTSVPTGTSQFQVVRLFTENPAPASMWIDWITSEGGATDFREVRIDRNAFGNPGLFGFAGPDGTTSRFALTPGPTSNTDVDSFGRLTLSGRYGEVTIDDHSISLGGGVTISRGTSITSFTAGSNTRQIDINATQPTGGKIRLTSPSIELNGPVTFLGDTEWAAVTVPNTTTASVFEWKMQARKVYCRFDITYLASVAAGAYADEQRILIPEGYRPAISTVLDVAMSGQVEASGTMNNVGGFRLRNLQSSAGTRFYGSGSWDI
ncbi:hypothetical protein ACFWHR_07630 [Leucobacter sp. NPDC058333]|uniref:hypothetical protein n=1 Tax=Leucobacter sp. NPDC058333 TaxID=3346450 RepID=UPI0036635144